MAQLTLKVNVEKDNELDDNEVVNIKDYPTDLSLNDEVRLNKIKYADSSDGEYPQLKGLQQAVILGML